MPDPDAIAEAKLLFADLIVADDPDQEAELLSSLADRLATARAAQAEAAARQAAVQARISHSVQEELSTRRGLPLPKPKPALRPLSPSLRDQWSSYLERKLSEQSE